MNDAFGRYYLHDKPEIVDSVQADSTVTKRMLRNCAIMPAGQHKVEWKEEYWVNKAAGTTIPVFEREPLESLAREGELMSYIHEGFWQCMDNIREKNLLDKLLQEDRAPWKKWDRSVPVSELIK